MPKSSRPQRLTGKSRLPMIESSGAYPCRFLPAHFAMLARYINRRTNAGRQKRRERTMQEDLAVQYEKLYRYCYFRVRDADLAEDLTQ